MYIFNIELLSTQNNIYNNSELKKLHYHNEVKNKELNNKLKIHSDFKIFSTNFLHYMEKH